MGTGTKREEGGGGGNNSSSEDEFYEAPETPTAIKDIETTLEKSIKELSLEGSSIRTGSPSVKPKMADLKPTDVDPLSLLSDDVDSGELAASVRVKAGHRKSSKGVKEETVPPAGRVGALKPYKDLLLLKTGEALYIPDTQVIRW